MTPKRCEIWRIPPVTDAKGTEIQGRRFVIVLLIPFDFMVVKQFAHAL